MSKARKYLPALWFVLVAFAWLGPTLAGRVIFALDADLAIYYYAILSFYSDALHAGQSFLWIPSIFSGFPVYLSQSGGFLDPINILIFSLLDGMTAVHVRLTLDIILTLTTSYLAARSLGLSRTAALLVGPSYLISLNLRYLSNPLTANTIFLLPLLIFTAHATIRGTLSPIRAGIIAGIGLGWALLAGYTQLIVYALLLAGLFTIGHVLWQKSDWKALTRRLAVFGVITLLLGSTIGLPFIVPAQKYFPLSARAEKAPLALTTLKSIEPGDLMLAFVPDYLYFPYITSGRKAMYVGTAWFFLALGALIVSVQAIRRRERTDAERGALVAGATGLFALVAAFKWSPIFWAMTYLPVIGLFRFPFRFMFLGTFLFALLGGYGLDMMREIVRVRAWKLFVGTVSVLTTVFVFCIFALHVGGDALIRLLANGGHSILGATVYGHAGFTKDPSHYRLAIENGLQAYREFFSIGDIGVVVGIGILILSCVVFIGILRKWFSEETGRWVTIGLISLTVLCVPLSQWSRFVTPEMGGKRPQTLNEYVGNDASFYRMYSFLPVVGTSKVIQPQYKLDEKEEDAVH